MVAHILLEELGVPYRRVPVDRAGGEHKSAAYLRLNPNGLIPVSVDGDLVLYETAAIVLHLADTHPAAGLAPALGTVEGAHFYKWPRNFPAAPARDRPHLGPYLQRMLARPAVQRIVVNERLAAPLV